MLQCNQGKRGLLFYRDKKRISKNALTPEQQTQAQWTMRRHGYFGWLHKELVIELCNYLPANTIVYLAENISGCSVLLAEKEIWRRKGDRVCQTIGSFQEFEKEMKRLKYGCCLWVPKCTECLILRNEWNRPRCTVTFDNLREAVKLRREDVFLALLPLCTDKFLDVDGNFVLRYTMRYAFKRGIFPETIIRSFNISWDTAVWFCSGMTECKVTVDQLKCAKEYGVLSAEQTTLSRALSFRHYDLVREILEHVNVREGIDDLRVVDFVLSTNPETPWIRKYIDQCHNIRSMRELVIRLSVADHPLAPLAQEKYLNIVRTDLVMRAVSFAAELHPEALTRLAPKGTDMTQAIQRCEKHGVYSGASLIRELNART